MLTLDCAKLIINRCIEVGHPIDLLYLQRIMYLCQIGHIKLSGKLLFIEQFEAWQIGPMLRSVYNEYYAYGGWNIDHKQNTKSLFFVYLSLCGKLLNIFL